MADPLQYGAMGILALAVIAVIKVASASFTRRDIANEALVADVLKTNALLRESMVKMSERQLTMGRDLHELAQATEGLRRDFRGAGIRPTPAPPEPAPEPIVVVAERRPRTDPTGRGRR